VNGFNVARTSRGTGLAAILVAGALLSACNAAATPVPTQAPSAAPTAAASTAASATPVAMQSATLRLDWVPTGYHAPFFYALEKGYYKDAGIDLQIFDGKGSGPSIQAVAAGTDTFALAAVTSMALSVAEGAKVKATAAMIQRQPDAIISLKDGANIGSVKGVEGKKMAYTAGSSGERLFSALAKVNNFDEAKVTKLTMDAGAKLTAVLNGSADFTVDWPFTRGPVIESQGKQGTYVYYADNGVNVLGHGLIVSLDTISSKPALVRAFTMASIKGIDESIKNPDAAVDAMIKNRPEIANQRAVQLAQFKGLADYLHTPATKGKPTGEMDAGDWDATLKLLTDYFGLKAGVSASSLYTNEFLK
jgi:NitT/TauT family transport system substrate-binding protein